MKKLFLFLCMAFVHTSCQTDQVSAPIEKGIKYNVSSYASTFGDLHNEAMDFISDSIRSNFETNNSLEISVFNITEAFLAPKAIEINVLEKDEVEEFLILAQNDFIHKYFADNGQSIKNSYLAFKREGFLNDFDLRLISNLLNLISEYNLKVVQQNASDLDETAFLNKLAEIYENFKTKEKEYSPITVGLIQIAQSSASYWQAQNLEFAPEFVTASWKKAEILPAIVLRVVIKDAIGAVTGALTTGLQHRIMTNDWDHDTGKISEDEALVGMLIGAITASGGFLGKLALRAVNFLL